MVWLYVPGLEASNSALISHSLNTGASVTSRGKPIQRRYLSRAWRRASWMKLLSGMTLRPSMAGHGVERWISSLPASPANPGAAPVSDVALRTSVGSGQVSNGSFAILDPDTCSWRTSQVSLQGDWIPFSAIWPKSGMMRSGICSQLPALEPRTFEKEFSFLPLKGCLFPTPTSKDSDPYTKPRADAMNSGYRRGATLPQIVGLWPTPVVGDSRRNSPIYPRGNRTLIGAIAETEKWPTPKASDAEGGLGARGAGGPNLKTEAGGKLNPNWVEWLMGWPIGWTAFEPVGTESFQRWQQGHLPSYLGDSDNMQESESK